ncbi:hypothetical protein E4O92_05605 [Massilia horti]|uniref:Uncharacterized protein n=1 Tax=Massilia horti TaxID=2562153 RepID=A0A4Y9T812_9BURK|nr:hypothetical protein E4O92_05605 [Massilia horti]
MLLAACLLTSQPSIATPLPVPADKSAYIGEWRGEKMRLNIQQDGKVEYKRERPGKNSKGRKIIDLNIELLGFDGNDFYAGYGIVSTTFVVSKPPYRDQGKWKMVVDGVELTRVEQL